MDGDIYRGFTCGIEDCASRDGPMTAAEVREHLGSAHPGTGSPFVAEAYKRPQPHTTQYTILTGNWFTVPKRGVA